MDNKTKLELLRVVESYWDILSPEMRELILAYKTSQELIDAREKKEMRELCKEIIQYGKVKEGWGLGHIKCVPSTVKCRGCGRKHMRIIGFYTSGMWNVKKRRFLGFSYEGVLERLHYIKLFLR